MKIRLYASAAVLAFLVGVDAAPARAAANLITNGDFEQTTMTSSGEINGTNVTGWANTATSGFTGYGYNFLYTPGTADTTGASNFASGTAILYGPNGSTSGPYSNYSANGLTATSPTGGNFLVADGDSTYSGAIKQTVMGLTAGQQYILSFYWATAEFAPVTNGATLDDWSVTFGGTTQSTQAINTAYKGFDVWQQASMTFVAQSTSQLLSFLAVGSPNGDPPALLLDGVSLVAAPEPSTWAVFVTAIVLGGLVTRRHLRKSAIAS